MYSTVFTLSLIFSFFLSYYFLYENLVCTFQLDACNLCLQDLIKSAFQDIVSAELEKIKESSLDENVRSSTSVPEANDMLWEYDGLTNVYQGDCEEILLEMQRIFYEDLTIHPTRKEGEKVGAFFSMKLSL